MLGCCILFSSRILVDVLDVLKFPSKEIIVDVDSGGVANMLVVGGNVGGGDAAVEGVAGDDVVDTYTTAEEVDGNVDGNDDVDTDVSANGDDII